MFLIFIFIIGGFIGSFLNVLADRLPKDESPFGGRSHCENCKKDLEWYDLIPLFSFFLLNGKCRYCHAPLSLYYPIVEFVTGVLFVLTLILLPHESIKYQVLSIKYFTLLFYYLFISSCLIVIFFADLKYGIIPDKIVFPAILIAFIYLILNTPYLPANATHQALQAGFILPHLLSGIGALLFFLLLFIITKGKGMGFGDVKFAFLMGLILGFPKIIIALYIAFLTGAIFGCIIIIWKRKRLIGTRIPFGPFLAIGTILALFFGDRIIQIVMRFMFQI